MILNRDIFLYILSFLSYNTSLSLVNKSIYYKHRQHLVQCSEKIKKYYRQHSLKHSTKFCLQNKQTLFVRQYSYHYNDVYKLPNLLCCQGMISLYKLETLKKTNDRNIYDIIVWVSKNISNEKLEWFYRTILILE